jgi:hypothetical protein
MWAKRGKRLGINKEMEGMLNLQNKMGNEENGRRKTSIWRSFRPKVAPINDGKSTPKIGQLNHRELGQNAPKFVGNPNDEAFLKV